MEPVKVDKKTSRAQLKKLTHIKIDMTGTLLGVVEERRGTAPKVCDLCSANELLWYVSGDDASGFCDTCLMHMISMLQPSNKGVENEANE